MLELLPAPARYLFPPERGKLRMDGATFRTTDNTLFQWRGYSWFLGFHRFCQGEDVTPDLRWLRSMGFNMVRVFGPLPWKETSHYRFENFRFDYLPDFFALLQRHGLRCNWSLAHYEHSMLHGHVQRWYDIASECDHIVAEAVNEPHNGTEKPDPRFLLEGTEELPDEINRHGVLTSYGLYKQYYDSSPGFDPVLDFGALHVQRDAAWFRKARHCQEWQHAVGKPIINDEPAKITEPDFDYPGGKNDPKTTPDEAVWNAAVSMLYTPGFTFHCEAGKWGEVPAPGTLQHLCAEAVRDQVFRKIDAYWQTGVYKGAHSSGSPVDGKGLQIDGRDIWTYSSVGVKDALSVRCARSEPKAINGWRVVESWGPGNSIVRLTR